MPCIAIYAFCFTYVGNEDCVLSFVNSPVLSSMDLELYESFWEEKFSCCASSRKIKYPNLGKVYKETIHLSENSYFPRVRLFMTVNELDRLVETKNLFEVGFFTDPEDISEPRIQSLQCHGRREAVNKEILVFDKHLLKSPWAKVKSARK